MPPTSKRGLSGERPRPAQDFRCTPRDRYRRAGHANALTDEEIAATDMGGDDVIAIDPQDWPKLRVLLEVLFSVGERDGLFEAAA